MRQPFLRTVGRIALGAIVLILSAAPAAAAQPEAVMLPPVEQLPAVAEMPNPFVMRDGTPVKTREDWAKRREELRTMILHYEFGQLPPSPGNVSAAEKSFKTIEALNATEREILLTIGCGNDKKIEYTLTLTEPRGKEGPLPVIVKGDLCWGRVAEPIRKEIARRGYILAEFDRTQIAPDKKGRDTGVYPIYPEYDWGAESAWAWGFHRTIDYLLTLKNVDAKRIIVTGHSRGGKAAILAGALDERIALTCPNGSGAGGAGSYRVLGPKCESLDAIARSFPFWFNERFQGFVGKADRLPFDHHSLRALVAPRAQLSTEALGDIWANPSGTQACYLAAKEVYKFLGAGQKIGIHFREGKHDHNAEDFAALLDFADRQLSGKQADRQFERLAFPDAPRGFSWAAPAGGTQ
jgi:dienelactone hydrolase